MVRVDSTKQHGFTLVEMLVVIGIIATIFAVSSVNLGRPQVAASLDSAVSELVADIKNQQLLAMSGDQGSTSAQQPQGIQFQSTNYTLFAGSSYSAGDSNNFTLNLGQGTTLSTTLPNTRVVFNKATGEVAGFVNGSNTITVTTNGTSKTITLSRFGAVSVN